MDKKERVLNVPNALTLLRLLSLPVVIVLFRRDLGLAAACVFVVGMATDCFDGWIARKLDQRTLLGLYLDPVVDKIVILSLFYELAFAGYIPTAISHLFLARELLQNAVRVVGAKRGKVVGANWMGKTKAALQTVLITWGLLTPVFGSWFSVPVADALLEALKLCSWAVLGLAWCFFGVFVHWNRRLF